jgi:hypothetical protein
VVIGRPKLRASATAHGGISIGARSSARLPMRRKATAQRGGRAHCELPAAARTHPWPCPAATLVGVEFDASLCSRQFYFIWLKCRSSRPVVLSSVTPGERPGRTANHGQGGLAANLDRHHHLRRLGCYRHNRQRLALGLDADGSVSTLDRIHQPL